MTTGYNHKDYVKRAKAAYNAKALKKLSLVISHTEPEVYEALMALTAHYGSQAGAIKEALLAHAKAINTK